jgi:hypothetical protein
MNLKGTAAQFFESFDETFAKRERLRCGEFYMPDPRNLHHQRFCSESACRKQRKTESQHGWLQEAETQSLKTIGRRLDCSPE